MKLARRSWSFIYALSVCFLCHALCVDSAHAQASYERPLSFSASQVISSKLRRGPNFRVNDKVLSDGYLYLITVQSDYGPYRVRGLETLKMRVHEFAALHALDEFSDSKVFLDAAKEAGIDIIMAPVHGVKRVIRAVEDPEEAWETVKKVPAGIGRLFSDVVDAVDTGLTKAGDFVRDQTSSTKSSEEKDSQRDSLSDKALDEATEIGLKHIGFSQRESEWYERYSLDQFTTNKPLRDKITRIAAVQAAVKLGSKFVPGVGQLKYISEINRGLSMAERLSLYKSPEEQKKRNHEMLAEMKVPPAVIEAFLASKEFSPSEMSRVVLSLYKLAGARNRQAFLVDAAGAKSREGAILFVQAAEFLAVRFPGTTAFLPDGSLPLAVVSPGRVVTPLALDFVSWTREVAAGAAKLRAASSKAGVSQMELHVSGRVSTLCRNELRKLGVSVVEGVRFTDR